MSDADDDSWQVAGQRFQSRLIVGTGRYKDLEETAAAIEASGAEIVTVAVRRVNLSDPKAPMLQDYVSPKRYTYLPNTAGCHTAKDAVRTLRLAREAGGWNLVKLEVLGPAPFLYPDMPATFEAAQALIADGFQVMVYCADDPLAAKRLEDMGCVAIMPLGAPIGSGMGVVNPYMISAIKREGDILGHRQRLKQREMLEDHANAKRTGGAGAFHRNGRAAPDQPARIRAQQPIDDLDQG